MEETHITLVSGSVDPLDPFGPCAAEQQLGIWRKDGTVALRCEFVGTRTSISMVGVEGCVHQVVQPWYLPRQNRIVAKRYEDLIQLVGRPLQRMMK